MLYIAVFAFTLLTIAASIVFVATGSRTTHTK